MKKEIQNFLFSYQYVIGLTLGLLYGSWAGYKALPFLILLWMIVIVERILK